MPGWTQTANGGVILNCRVVPRAGKNAVQGLMGEAVKIRLTAPPVEGKANKALVEFLAEALDVARADVEILAGETSRNKRVFVRGLAEAQVRQRLGM